jgi:polyisoprenoid-binding protein YceI
MTDTKTQQDALRGTWTLDTAHTGIEFAVRYTLFATVRGHFRTFEGTINVPDPADPATATVHLEIDTASIDTGHNDRDNHVRSADFLDVERFPKMVFDSTRVESKGGDELTVWGNLTIRDVTREVEIPVTFNGVATDPFGRTRAGFEATVTIDRKEWGVSWNAPLEAGGFLVGDKVKLNLDVSAIKQG